MMLTLADAWVHDLDPVALRIGGFALRWYGLSYVMGFIVAGLLLRWLAIRGATPIPKDRAMDVIVWLVGGVLIGGRLGYVLFYQPSLLWTFRADFPFWDLLALHRGGMASHGGIIGVCVAALRICRGWKTDDGSITGKCPPLHVMDMIALIATPGLMFGRLANFINGELLGKVVSGPGQPGPWWAVRFWQEVPERWDELPSDQQALIAQSAGVSPRRLTVGTTESIHTAIDDSIDHVYMLGVAARQGTAGATERLAELINARHPSQLYQALAEGVIAGLVVWWIARQPHRPGLIGAWFLMVYGVGRILTEIYRLPDTHIERFIGLSRGQWLSVGMIAVGIGVLWSVTRGPLRKTAQSGGWKKSSV